MAKRSPRWGLKVRVWVERDGQHTGGANFALSDGCVRFIRDTMPVETLQLICVRSDGQVVGLK